MARKVTWKKLFWKFLCTTIFAGHKLELLRGQKGILFKRCKRCGEKFLHMESAKRNYKKLTQDQWGKKFF